MARLVIDLTWWRDGKGYRLVEARAPGKPKTDPRLGIVTPVTMVQADPGSPKRIVRVGGKLEDYRPMEKYADTLLPREFAKATTPAALLEFVARFGPLTQAGLDQERGEDVGSLIREAAAMRQALLDPKAAQGRLREHGAARIGSIEAVLIADRGARPTVQFTVPDLLTALWLRVGEHLSGISAGDVVRQCEHCGALFEVGPNSKPQRRFDARFCSDAHRVAFNSLKRSQRR
jgi:hypothetical protein